MVDARQKERVMMMAEAAARVGAVEEVGVLAASTTKRGRH